MKNLKLNYRINFLVSIYIYIPEAIAQNKFHTQPQSLSGTSKSNLQFVSISSYMYRKLNLIYIFMSKTIIFSNSLALKWFPKPSLKLSAYCSADPGWSTLKKLDV